MKICVYGIQPILILVYTQEYDTYTICKHFDPSVDAGSRYYKYDDDYVVLRRVYDLNLTNVYDKIVANNQIFFRQLLINNSCIGEFPGKNLDKCSFNGYLDLNELCNPCEKKEFKEQCAELCKTTTGFPFGAYSLK